MENYNKILHYCNTVKTHDLAHLEDAIENATYIKHRVYDMLNGCPMNFGAEDYVGLCEIEDVSSNWEKQKAQCLDCWTKALKIEVQEE